MEYFEKFSKDLLILIKINLIKKLLEMARQIIK